MTSNKNSLILATLFVAAGVLAAAIVMSAVGASMNMPAFAQGDNMTGGGNATEGNMTGTDTAESGMATPPMMTP